MDPRDVGSAQDVRDGWAGWDSDERLDALGALANANLADYDYDRVDVYNDGGGGYTGSTDGAGIHLDQGLLDSDDPENAIHVTDHETVHWMDDQDGIDSDTNTNVSDFPEDHVFTEEEADSILNHQDVGDQARVLDQDGYVDRSAPRSGAGGGGPSPGGAFDGSGDGAGSPAPPSNELSFEIDWASGVWIDSTHADGSYEVSIYFAPMEGW